MKNHSWLLIGLILGFTAYDTNSKYIQCEAARGGLRA